MYEDVDSTHFELRTAVEEFQCCRDELVSLHKVPHTPESPHHGIEPLTPIENGRHLEFLFLVDVLVLPVVQFLDHVFCGVAEQTSHAIHYSHAVTMLEREGGREREREGGRGREGERERREREREGGREEAGTGINIYSRRV